MYPSENVHWQLNQLDELSVPFLMDSFILESWKSARPNNLLEQEIFKKLHIFEIAVEIKRQKENKMDAFNPNNSHQ